MTDLGSRSTFRIEVEEELRQDILPYWLRLMDRERGGFFGLVSHDNRIDREADKGCILNSRILWTFSAAHRLLGVPAYREAAWQAYDFLRRVFWDERHSGLYWMVDAAGKPVQTRKQIYNLAFGIYGLAEYHRMSGDPESLDRAVRLFQDIEAHSHDRTHLGYIEGLTEDWQPIADLRLSDKDLNEKKSMNTHLHVLEAYTNLLRVWKDPKLEEQQTALLGIMLDRILDPATAHFRLFFDESWHSRVSRVSYGHDIEGSWLMCEAAEVLGFEPLRIRVREIAARMARCALAEGLDPEHGGLFDESLDGKPESTDKSWWPQAEAVVGFLNGFELTGEQKFFEAAMSTWRFIQAHFVDRQGGEWYWRVDRTGRVPASRPKVEPWKCPYHNSRACMEAMDRLDRLAD